MKTTKYWLAVASQDHVQNGVQGGFMQVNHGKEAPLKRMNPGDKVIFYSPKLKLTEKTICQCFTAIGEVEDAPIYTVQLTDEFHPFRRKVTFAKSDEAPIAPLLKDLSFIKNKKSWGYTFRLGFFEISESDFQKIADAIKADW